MMSGRTSSARPDYTKRPDDRYGSGGRGGYDSRPTPGAYQHDSRYRHDDHYGVGSPPPANYGHGPPPQGYHGRPPIAAQSRPPPTPAPPRDANDRDALWRLFGAVDKDSALPGPGLALLQPNREQALMMSRKRCPHRSRATNGSGKRRLDPLRPTHRPHDDPDV